MSAKRKCESDSVTKKRKWLTLEQKLDVIKLHEEGASFAKIGREKGMDESSVRKLIKKKEQYKSQGMATASYLSKVVTKTRSTRMVNVERLLSIWIEDLNQKRIPLSQMEIQAKALSLYNDLKTVDNIETEGEGTSENFTASRGWFFRFKQRTGIHNVRIVGESASADKEAASRYPRELSEIIQKGGYKDEQIFNVDETGLFWKKLPSRTFISVNENSSPGYKISKDRLTLLLGGNAAGDFKIKPMLVYRAENPRALKNLAKNKLPVLWRSNKKAWVTKALFEDWFTNYFCPTTKRYCRENGLDFKILLILDNAPGHSTSLCDLNENVKITFIPPNTTSLIQPMDQGVIATFKAYYLRRTFSQAIKATTGENAPTLTEFWKSYNIRNVIENIDEAWNELTASNMRSVWKHIIPHCANDFIGFETHFTEVTNNIVEIGQQLGFKELDSVNVIECIELNTNELDNETLLNIDEQRAYEEQEDNLDNENCVEVPAHELTAEQLSKIIGMVESLSDHIMEVDPNFERGQTIRRTINNSIRCYKEMYEDKRPKKKTAQTSILQFFEKK